MSAALLYVNSVTGGFHWILQDLSQKVLYKIPVNEYPLYNQIKDFRNTFGKIGCIERWIKFNNIYDFTCQKTLIQTLFSLFLQCQKPSPVSLSNIYF